VIYRMCYTEVQTLA